MTAKSPVGVRGCDPSTRPPTPTGSGIGFCCCQWWTADMGADAELFAWARSVTDAGIVIRVLSEDCRTVEVTEMVDPTVRVLNLDKPEPETRTRVVTVDEPCPWRGALDCPKGRHP